MVSNVNFYCSQNVVRVIKSRMLRGVGHVACMVEIRKMLENTKEKTPLWSCRFKWKNNIKINLRNGLLL